MMADRQRDTQEIHVGEAARDGLFGFFELDSANKVLYSRYERGEGPAPPDASGRTLFAGASLFANAEELRQRINHFRHNGAKTDSFDFECQWAGGPLPVRVLLARIYGSSGYSRTKSVLVHIRPRH
jgi:hypothetical protein